jgi:hypothetical protein
MRDEVFRKTGTCMLRKLGSELMKQSLSLRTPNQKRD